MNERDKAILKDLKNFRVLTRDQLVQLHFTGNTDPAQSCNKVMKRLTRDGHVEANTSVRPYVYFPSPSPFKKDSMKIPHFTAIADFYIELCKIHKPDSFEVEFKTGTKGSVEPDVYMRWNGAPFFVEIQRSKYSHKVMEQKIGRYKQYYSDGDWRQIGKYFPYVWILSDYAYNIDQDPLRILQSKTVDDMISKYMTKRT